LLSPPESATVLLLSCCLMRGGIEFAYEVEERLGKGKYKIKQK